jgi:phenylacetate-CoA ligase
MSVFDRKNETMPREALALCQLERLQALLARLKRNVQRYRDLLGDLRVESLDDLAKLPVTEPEELASEFPYGMFALPLREVIRLHSTAGPDGRQLIVGHTRNDMTHWARLAARQLVGAGVTSQDVIQICFAGGAFNQALGYLRGAELIEASVIPEDPFHVEHQLATLQSYRTTVLITTPANAQQISACIARNRIEPQTLALRCVLLTRPIPAALRAELVQGLLSDVRCGFGVPEILDPGLCVECSQSRLHVNEDCFLVETRDGELLVTTLCREATPLLRYCTRISCRMDRAPCECGRTGVVLTPGDRRDGQFRVNEMPLYTANVAAVLEHTPAAGQRFRFEAHEDRIVLSIEVTEAVFSDTMRVLADLKNQIESEFLVRLGVQSQVRFTTPERP